MNSNSQVNTLTKDLKWQKCFTIQRKDIVFFYENRDFKQIIYSGGLKLRTTIKFISIFRGKLTERLRLQESGCKAPRKYSKTWWRFLEVLADDVGFSKEWD
jgi:hypothetical protein